MKIGMDSKEEVKMDTKIKWMTTTGILAGFVVLFTAFLFHIPVGTHGGYIHLGDTFIYLAASILPQPYALLVGAIGGGLSDLLTSPAWAPATVIIKILITFAFSSKQITIWSKRNGAALLVASFITVIGYALAEAIMYGSFATVAVSISGNVIQAVGSAAAYITISKILDRTGFKKKLSLQKRISSDEKKERKLS